jgi:AcrR family transcriptional regulator
MTTQKTEARRHSRGAARPSHAPAGWPDHSYLEHLRRKHRDSADTKRKGERTRDALIAATVQILDERGYHAMRIADICEAAEVSSAAFYQYFDNKLAITLAVLNRFLDDLVGLTKIEIGTRSHYERMREINLGWIRAVRANPGLFRCILQVGDEVPQFAEVTSRINAAWHERMAASIIRRTGSKDDRTAALAARLVATLLGGMVDELMRALFVRQDETVTRLFSGAGMSDEELADFISVLSYRAIYGRSPKGAAGRHARWLAKLTLPD